MQKLKLAIIEFEGDRSDQTDRTLWSQTRIIIIMTVKTRFEWTRKTILITEMFDEIEIM